MVSCLAPTHDRAQTAASSNLLLQNIKYSPKGTRCASLTFATGVLDIVLASYTFVRECVCCVCACYRSRRCVKSRLI